MILRPIVLLTIAGVPVLIGWSWIPIIPLLLWSLAESTMPALAPELTRPVYWGMALAAASGLIVSLLLRETLYIIVAGHSGIPLRSVILFVFGGVAEAQSACSHIKSELMAATAGMLTSMALGVLCFALFIAATNAEMPLAALGVILFLMGVNWLIALANLLPVYPMSGGRVLAAVLRRWIRDARAATRFVALIRGVVGVAITVAGGWVVISGNSLAGLWTMLAGLLVIRIVLFRPQNPAAPEHPNER